MKLAALAWLTTRRHEPVPWSPRAWRQALYLAGYNLVTGPLLAVAALAAIGTWVAGIGCALVYTYAWRLPATNGLYRGIGGAPGPLRVLHIPQDVYLIAAGIAGLLIAPWLTAA